MNLKDLITRALQERFAPTHLVVTDESHQHQGHADTQRGDGRTIGWYVRAEWSRALGSSSHISLLITWSGIE